MAKAAAYVTLQVTHDFDLTLEGGCSMAFAGSFDANYISLQLGMALDHPHS